MGYKKKIKKFNGQGLYVYSAHVQAMTTLTDWPWASTNQSLPHWQAPAGNCLTE